MEKICFIICTNKEYVLQECLLYLEQLHVPEGYEVEVLTVRDAKSMAAGYNYGMKHSDAKYKIYMHQDVFIYYHDFLQEILSLFTKYPKIGMIGMVGNTSLGKDGALWNDAKAKRKGEVLLDLIVKNQYACYGKVENEYEKVLVIDGLLMATQYDIPWREDLFSGWDMYDCSQSMEFHRAGYDVVVPKMDAPWCVHDNDILDMDNYEKWHAVFKKEYEKDWRES